MGTEEKAAGCALAFMCVYVLTLMVGIIAMVFLAWKVWG